MVDKACDNKICLKHDECARHEAWLKGDQNYKTFKGKEDRKSVVQGKSVDLGGRRSIKKKKRSNEGDVGEKTKMSGTRGRG